MPKKPNYEDLSVEELERLLKIKKREERHQRFRKMERNGRVANAVPPPPVVAAPRPVITSRREDEIVIDPTALPAETSDDTRVVPARPVKPARKATVESNIAVPQFEEELSLEEAFPEKQAEREEEKRFWRGFTNQILLLVEITAVVGLVFLALRMFTAIGTLEDETAEAQRLAEEQRRASIPTLAPTPQLTIDDVVLPSGHTPPTEPGGGQFNFAEIPANLLPLVQSQVLAPVLNRPPPTSETALRIIIPKIGVDHTIVQGTDWDALRLGVGQVQNGVNPTDDEGNLVLAAHNDIYGEIFRFLDQLEAGDEFQILTATQTLSYVIEETQIVEPDDVHVMDNRPGLASATLISCYPYHVDTQRYIVFATRT